MPWLVSTSTTMSPCNCSRRTWQCGTTISRLLASSVASDCAARAALMSKGMLLNLLDGKRPERTWLCTASGASSLSRFRNSCFDRSATEGE